MLMVVLGAGASYDSCPQADWRPPLAKELFADRPDFRPILARWPAAVSIVGRMRALELEGGMVEDRLAEFVTLARETNDPSYKRDIAALRFYLQEVIRDTTQVALGRASGLSTYVRLVTRLHDLSVRWQKQVFFVTFNYDTLIEDAIRRRFGYTFGDLRSYIEAPMPVMKPHGSVDWVERIDRLSGPAVRDLTYMHDSQLTQAAQMDLFSSSSGRVSKYDPRNANTNRDHFILPALAMPISNKDAFMMPSLHLEALTDLLTRVTSVLIVGWRASETEFTKLCNERLRGWQQLPSHVITYGDSRDVAAEVIKNFSPHLGPNTDIDIRGFSAAMDDPAHDGLERLFS